MRHYEFNYTITASGIKNTFTLPDPAEDAVGAEIARAVLTVLNRNTNISDVTAIVINDVRTVTRSDMT